MISVNPTTVIALDFLQSTKIKVRIAEEAGIYTSMIYTLTGCTRNPISQACQ